MHWVPEKPFTIQTVKIVQCKTTFGTIRGSAGPLPAVVAKTMRTMSYPGGTMKQFLDMP